MAPSYKLRYFNGTGLGEPIRYLLSYAKIDFEDDRIEFADFPAIKPGLPFGVLPLLEVDGKVAHQSTAICRYIGKKAGIAGKDDWEALEIDIVVDSITDYRMHYTAYFRTQDEKLKAEILEKCVKEHNPYYLSRLEKIVVANKGFFVNGKLSWADVYFGAVVNMFKNVTKCPQMLDEYPGLNKLQQLVENLPGIKEYIAKRPVTMI